MTKSEILQSLKFFLSSNNALEAIEKQLRDRRYNSSNNFDIFIDRLYDDERINEVINYSFQWDMTHEGRDFWAKLNMEWKNMCSKKEFPKLLYNTIW